MSTQQGISFTEFTYQLLQGYDFYELYRTHGCTIQIGGSDQWGNILSGVELINKVEHSPLSLSGDDVAKEKGFALTTPLLTTSRGEKFGKSAGNAIWLEHDLTSYLDFYQVCPAILQYSRCQFNDCSSSCELATRTWRNISNCLRCCL